MELAIKRPDRIVPEYSLTDFRYPFMIVEQTDLAPPGEHYIQVHMDLTSAT